MASAAQRVSATTTLVVGKVEIPIGLFASSDKPGKLAEFAKAGPNGGRLMAEAVARPVPVGEIAIDHTEPVIGDPLGEMFDAAKREPEGVAAADEALHAAVAEQSGSALGGVPSNTNHGASVEGEYGRQLVEEGTGVVVTPENVRRGVRLEDGRFIDCTEQLADIEAKTRIERAEVVGFVAITQVARARVKAAQYIGAVEETGPVALRLFYEGMKRRRRVMVVKITKRSRQTLAIIGWHGESLMLYELVWAEDFRPPPARALVMHKARVSEQQLAQVSDLIDAMALPMSALDLLRDDAIVKRQALMALAKAGKVEKVIAPPEADPVDDVMAQLEASLAAVKS